MRVSPLIWPRAGLFPYLSLPRNMPTRDGQPTVWGVSSQATTNNLYPEVTSVSLNQHHPLPNNESSGKENKRYSWLCFYFFAHLPAQLILNR